MGLTYDALGRMVEQNRGGVYTQILYSPVGKTAIRNGQTRKTINLPLPGGATAVYDTTFDYRYGDWLGSSRFSSTTSRTKFSDDAYAPYGETYAESGTVDPSFTGNDQDTVSGTYDFLFREYNANQGRWISPNPAGLGAVSLGDPQTWNRYAYVANNPLGAVDPLGLTDCPQGKTCNDYGHGNPGNGCAPGDASCGGDLVFGVHLLGGHLMFCDEWSGGSVGEGGHFTGCVPVGSGLPPQDRNQIPANNNARSRLDQIVNHLQQCGGIYSLV